VYDVDADIEIGSLPYVPAYRANDHTHSLIIDTSMFGVIGSDVLHFGVSDGIFDDNSGGYRVDVRQLEAAVPEPATLTLLGTAIAASALVARGRGGSSNSSSKDAALLRPAPAVERATDFADEREPPIGRIVRGGGGHDDVIADPQRVSRNLPAHHLIQRAPLHLVAAVRRVQPDDHVRVHEEQALDVALDRHRMFAIEGRVAMMGLERRH
jgi:PEP-CTERM motif